MRKLFLIIPSLILMTLPLEASSRRHSSDDIYVEGHYRKHGTYVEPYYRSAPNRNQWDNYGYTPSQPTYNQPRLNTPSNWNAPNPGRLNDDNPYNDSAPELPKLQKF